MIWTTWRQHRAEATTGAAILLALAAAMIVVGSIARDRAHALGLPACRNAGGACGDALDRLHSDFHTIPPFIAALVALPLLAGMFWAAPLLSREYEAGTHRLAWTQSVSPVRWITVKIALIFSAVGGAALILGLLASWALDPLTGAFGSRFNSTWYDTQGIVPVACVLFALAIGVAASAVIRRTIPAMAITLIAYAAVRVPIHLIRWRFASLTTRTLTVPLSTLIPNPTGSPQDLATSSIPTGAWVHAVQVSDPAGHLITGNTGNFALLQNYCPNLQTDASRTAVLDPASCAARVHGLSLHAVISYQPASHFWLIQTVETTILIGLAALIVAAAILVVSRHRPT